MYFYVYHNLTDHNGESIEGHIYKGQIKFKNGVKLTF